tara:strand:- start:2435 stop:3349 length:915 start_codon:yes stop_codon:yes gene_type:complete
MRTKFKKQSNLKIVCIGCSWTEGLASDIERTSSYPYSLFKKLKTMTDKKVSVYNLGIGGSGAKVHKNLFEYACTVIKPNIVIHQITDAHRVEIMSERDQIFDAFYLNNEIKKEGSDEDDYHEIAIDKNNWTILPIIRSHDAHDKEFPWAAVNPFLKKNRVPDIDQDQDQAGTIENVYMNYIKQNYTMTFQQFQNFCLYKNAVEKFSKSNQLDYVADVDYILNSKYANMFSFFWLGRSRKMYNSIKNKHAGVDFAGTDVEAVFKENKKIITEYSHDEYLHLNKKGNDIVADWIIDELINRKKLSL